jgi:acyl-coenzyme A thioesterase PaaI-like protein
MEAFQDFYPDEFAQCYGCGRLNKHGRHLRSSWDGEETVARYTPRPEEIALPGFVNGGVLAALIDCHATGTAAAVAYRAEERPMGSLPAHRFVTASLHVDFLSPTPLGPELEIRGKLVSIEGRHVVVDATISVEGRVTVRGRVLSVEIPASMDPRVRHADPSRVRAP